MIERIPAKVDAYLEKFVTTFYNLERSRTDRIQNAVVIPVLMEFDNLKRLLLSLSENDPKYFSETEFIFVVNNTVSASFEIKNDNLKSIEFLRSIIAKETKEEIKRKIVSSGLSLSLVNAAEKNYAMSDRDGGVGLARKIGMDSALNIFDYDNKNKKLFLCLDADCTVQKNYLTEVVDHFRSNKNSAAVISYEHPAEENSENSFAIICYEIYLRYYLLGLKYALSKFSFHTIGSTMVCDHEAYIKVGGMNKRKAAEDFYFLEKLAKSFSIHTINTTKVYPSSRESFRVPFGTGQRVTRFLSKTRNEYLLYNPVIFEILKNWNELFSKSELQIKGRSILDSSEEIDKYLYDFLIENDFENAWEKIKSNSITIDQLNKQKYFWFDGFRTLKLVHFLRDNKYGEIYMFDALDILLDMMDIDFKNSHDYHTSYQFQLEYLIKLRQLT